jgi:hypothetical protein
MAVVFFITAAWVWFIGNLYHNCHHSLIAQIWYSVFHDVILYVYSFSVSGSIGFLLIFFMFIITQSHTVHSIHAVAPLYVIFALWSGIGYIPFSVIYISKLFCILFISAILLPSLEFLLYHYKLMKAIVARIARIVITTISSTRVKACLFFCFIILYLKNI